MQKKAKEELFLVQSVRLFLKEWRWKSSCGVLCMVHSWPEGKQPARNLSRGLTIHINSHVRVDACRQATADVKVLKAKLRQSFSRFLWRAKRFGLSFCSCNSSLLDSLLFAQSLCSPDSFWQSYRTPHQDHSQKSIRLYTKGQILTKNAWLE